MKAIGERARWADLTKRLVMKTSSMSARTPITEKKKSTCFGCFGLFYYVLFLSKVSE